MQGPAPYQRPPRVRGWLIFPDLRATCLPDSIISIENAAFPPQSKCLTHSATEKSTSPSSRGSESLAARTAHPTRWPLRPPPVYRWERKFGSEKAPPTCWPLRPPPVYRWERKFGSENGPPNVLAPPPPAGSPVGAKVWQREGSPPIIKKKAVCPLVTPASV
jgi:hypothetical protein